MISASAITPAVSGALAMGYAVSALFFARAWRRSGSRIFAWFMLAFALLAVQRVLLVTLSDDAGQAMPWSYVVRLAAFVLILAGIAEQNRRR